MPRLFWKIFFLIWIVNAVVFALGMSLAHVLGDRRDQNYHRNFPISEIADNAITAHEHGNLKRFYRSLHRRLNIRGYLLDAQGKLLPADAKIREIPVVPQYPHFAAPASKQDGRHIHAVKMVADSGVRYHFIATYKSRESHRPGKPPGPLLLLFLVANALTSLLIARFITRPLRSLQDAARKFASGQLTARVSEKVTARKDVVGELGCDFNIMAQRLNLTLASQLRLLRDISHELRTPLARMQVAVTLAEDASSGAEQPLARINTEIQRLDALIGQVLTLSRIESGADVLQLESVSLAPILEQIVSDARFEYTGQGKTVKLECLPDILVMADVRQLQSAIENIVRNGMRHTRNNSEVRVAGRILNCEVQVTVEDQGPGVPETDLERLFDAFFRCEVARGAGAAERGGHGVGLAISRGIVKAHGGTIRAYNTSGCGLCVEIRLSAQKAAESTRRVS